MVQKIHPQGVIWGPSVPPMLYTCQKKMTTMSSMKMSMDNLGKHFKPCEMTLFVLLF